MTDRLADARATLAAWREQGADRRHAVSFHLMEALAQRAAQQDGAARRLLEDKLCGLVDAYAAELKQTAALADDAAQAGEPARSPLGELLDHINDRASTNAPDGVPAFPELPALDAFRRTWSGIRVASQWQQSMQPVPENAGPLNSGTLVHRSIALMRELSPGYLQQFLAYVDDLAWLAQIHVPGPAQASDAPPTTTTRKRTRKKKPATSAPEDAG